MHLSSLKLCLVTHPEHHTFSSYELFIQQAINELKVAREEAILQIQQQNVKKKEKKSKK